MESNIDYERALMDPSMSFAQPADVLQASELSLDQKLALLKRWEQDAREIEVAEEEGMTGESRSQLSAVMQAIDSLDPQYHQGGHAPNKQGNVTA